MKIENWLAGIRKSNRRRKMRRPVAEPLESRVLLTVLTEFDPVRGELEVKSNADDDIIITSDGTSVLVNGQSTGVGAEDVVFLEVKGGPGGNLIDVSGVAETAFMNLQELEVKGNAGNDTLIGSHFDDELEGGPGDDAIRGEDGDDRLRGNAGDDTLDGGDGDDSVISGNGHDSLDGGNGDDSMRAGNGRDTLSGGAGNDKLSGEHAKDTLMGGDGDDTISGGRGPDELNGDAGRDSLIGGTSDDLMKGGDGDDSLNGGRGDDILDGDDGDDFERNGFSTDLESTFLAALDGVDGEAKFERDVDGDVELEFELEVEHTTPGVYDVEIDGVAIGQITVNPFGRGKLEYSTEPDDEGESQLPSDFPTIAAGSVITIAGLGSGTFDQHEDIELETDMTPINGSSATGEVEFEADGPERKFKLEIEGASPGTYDLIVDGVVVETLTIDSDDFRLEYEDDDGENSFPENFPSLDVGSSIELEGLSLGTF